MSPSSKVCRVCLSVDVTMCRIADTPLQLVYEKLTNSPVKKKPVSLTEHQTNSPMKPQPSSAERIDTAPSVEVEIKSEEVEDVVEMENEVLEESLLASDPIDSLEVNRSDGLDPLSLSVQRDAIAKEEDITHDGELDKRRTEAPRNDVENHFARNTREMNEKPIVCHICRCTFKHMSNLKKHLHSHSGIKYECSICQRFFSSKGNLKVHIRTHIGEKPHKCDFCQYISKSEEELQWHFKTHGTRS